MAVEFPYIPIFAFPNSLSLLSPFFSHTLVFSHPFFSHTLSSHFIGGHPLAPMACSIFIFYYTLSYHFLLGFLWPSHLRVLCLISSTIPHFFPSPLLDIPNLLYTLALFSLFILISQLISTVNSCLVSCSFYTHLSFMIFFSFGTVISPHSPLLHEGMHIVYILMPCLGYPAKRGKQLDM